MRSQAKRGGESGKAGTIRGKRAKARALKARVEQLMDAVLKEGGIDDPAPLIDDGMRWFVTDDAEAVAYAEIDGGEVLFHVVSEIMPVPSDRDLNLAFMHELLEVNSNALGGARFSIIGGDVYVTATDNADGMADEQVDRQIQSVVMLAGAMQTDLRKRYRRAKRGRRTPSDHK